MFIFFIKELVIYDMCYFYKINFIFKYKQVLLLSQKMSFDTSCLIHKNMDLRIHQVDFIQEFFNSDQHGMAAIHPTGSGKTFLSIALAECYLSMYPANTVIFCAPKTLKNNISKEIEKIGGVKDITKYRFFTIDGFYRGYIKHEMFIQGDKPDNEDVESDEEEEIIGEGAFSTKNTLFIIDEAHNLKTEIKINSDKGKKAYAYIRAASEADRVFITTATPLVNYTSDVSNLISMLSYNPKKEFYSKKQFEKVLEDHTKAKEVLGGKFGFHTLTKSDLEEYPTVGYENVYLKMPQALYKYYKAQELYLSDAKTDDIENDFFEGNLSAFYTGVRMAANLTPEELEGALAKSNWIKQFVKSHIDVHGKLSKKFIIYSQYVKYGVLLIEKELNDIGIECGLVIGTASEKQRDEMVARYNNGGLQVLILSKCGREGIDTKGTDYVIINENGWNISNENQVVGRARRRGSHKDFTNKHVQVLRLLMVKPSEFEYGPDKIVSLEGKYNHLDELKSIDLLLMSLSNKKVKILDNVFNMIKSYNTAIKADREFLKSQGDNAVSELTRILFTENNYRPLIISRIGTEGIHNSILLIGKKQQVYLQLPLAIFNTHPTTVHFNKQSDSDVFFFTSEWVDGNYKIYLTIDLGKVDELYMNSIISIIEKVIDNGTIPSRSIKYFEQIYKKLGVYMNVKNKDTHRSFIKGFATIATLQRNVEIKISLLFRALSHGCMSFGQWDYHIINGELYLRSNFDINDNNRKLFHILHKDNLHTFEVNNNESVGAIFNNFFERRQDSKIYFNGDYIPNNTPVNIFKNDSIFTV